MNLTAFLKEMEEKRWCGTTYLSVYERPEHTEWELSVFEHLPLHQVSPAVFKASLIQVENNRLATAILATLLRLDLVYSGKIMALEKAKSFAKGFCSLFSSQALYFSNSTWNKNEYNNQEKGFELGLSSWTPLMEATVDSGIIICDTDKIGIAWFGDDD